MIHPSPARLALAWALATATGGCSSTRSANSPGVRPEGGANLGSDNDGSILEGSAEGGAEDANLDVDEGGAAGTSATGPIIGTPLATFDSNADGFALNTFSEATNLALATPPATLTWISTDGSPDPGCLKITAPYSGPNQWVDVEAPSFSAPLPDWSGRVLHVRIKADPSSAFSGSARLYVKTGASYFFYPIAFAPFPSQSGWQEVVLPLVSPAPVPPAIAGADPSQVITFGVDPITAPVPATTPAQVTFYVDSFSIE